MSLALYIASEDSALQEQVFVNGKMIGQYHDHLGVLSIDNGGRHIEELIETEIDIDQFTGDFSLSEEEIEKVKAIKPKWYAPEDGLAYFTRLLDLIERDPLLTESNRELISEELKEFTAAFNILVKKKVRFHLKIDY